MEEERDVLRVQKSVFRKVVGPESQQDFRDGGGESPAMSNTEAADRLYDRIVNKVLGNYLGGEYV